MIVTAEFTQEKLLFNNIKWKLQSEKEKCWITVASCICCVIEYVTYITKGMLSSGKHMCLNIQ